MRTIQFNMPRRVPGVAPFLPVTEMPNAARATVAMTEPAASKPSSHRGDVQFRNTRFDPDLTPFHGLAQEMAAQFGYSATLPGDGRLLQLLRLRVAQLAPCSYCLILHTDVAIRTGISPALIAHLPSWRESGMFSSAERAALAYCEGLTLFHHDRFALLHEEARRHYSEQEIAEIAAVVINMNVWTRLKLAQGAVPVAGP